MITELFYPKEMKELIAKYRAEGTLNEEAVKHFNRNSYTCIVVCIVAAILLYSSNHLIGIAFIIATPLLAFYENKRLFEKNILAYSYGKKTKLHVEKMRFYYQGRQKIFCSLVR